MMFAQWTLLVLAVALLAGCTQDADPADVLVDAAPISEATWEGYAVVGAAYDGPAHFNPPEGALTAIWKEGFLLDVQGKATAMEFSMEWTGAAGSRVLLMAHSPHGEGHKMTEYTTEFTDAAKLCLRIPPADLEHMEPGLWMPMFHTQAAADVKAKITVRAVGAPLEVLDQAHGHDPTDTEELVELVALLAGATPHDPCDGEFGA